jgi:hypothetical protein
MESKTLQKKRLHDQVNYYYYYKIKWQTMINNNN